MAKRYKEFIFHDSYIIVLIPYTSLYLPNKKRIKSSRRRVTESIPAGKKVGYTTVTLKQKKVQFPSPTFLQASPNTLLHVGITDWCLSFCDGCKWAMYMAFQFEVLHLENL